MGNDDFKKEETCMQLVYLLFSPSGPFVSSLHFFLRSSYSFLRTFCCSLCRLLLSSQIQKEDLHKMSVTGVFVVVWQKNSQFQINQCVCVHIHTHRQAICRPGSNSVLSKCKKS